MRFKDKVDNNGNILAKDGILVEIEKDDVKDGVITIPSHVVEIGGYLLSTENKIASKFAWDMEEDDDIVGRIKKIIIPETVEHIGKSAFSGFKNLMDVEFLGDSNLKIISTNAFKDCESLEHIDIPEKVEKIYGNAFKGCKSLKKLKTPKDSMIVFTDSYFENLTSLEELDIQGEAAYLEEYGGEVLLDDYTEKITKLSKIKELTGEKAIALINITIPKSITEIDDWAFSEYSRLEKIIIPEGVKEIGEYAFFSCINLSDITIPKSVSYIREKAFGSCLSLSKINIPENVTKIGVGVFAHCRSLEDIRLPENITVIDDNLFFNCEALTKIFIPKNVKKIGKNAFIRMPKPRRNNNTRKCF